MVRLWGYRARSFVSTIRRCKRFLLSGVITGELWYIGHEIEWPLLTLTNVLQVFSSCTGTANHNIWIWGKLTAETRPRLAPCARSGSSVRALLPDYELFSSWTSFLLSNWSILGDIPSTVRDTRLKCRVKSWPHNAVVVVMERRGYLFHFCWHQSYHVVES